MIDDKLIKYARTRHGNPVGLILHRKLAHNTKLNQTCKNGICTVYVAATMLPN